MRRSERKLSSCHCHSFYWLREPLIGKLYQQQQPLLRLWQNYELIPIVLVNSVDSVENFIEKLELSHFDCLVTELQVWHSRWIGRDGVLNSLIEDLEVFKRFSKDTYRLTTITMDYLWASIKLLPTSLKSDSADYFLIYMSWEMMYAGTRISPSFLMYWALLHWLIIIGSLIHCIHAYHRVL